MKGAVLEPRLSTISRSEVLRYLGCKGDADPATLQLVERAAVAVLEGIRPRAVWQLFEVASHPQGLVLPQCGLVLPGDDLARHLNGCREAVLMAVTLSPSADALIRRGQVEDLALGVALDCSATAAVETVCDLVQAAVADAFPDSYLTSRFSPGYGDLPLSLQSRLLALLDAPRRIGLCANQSSILTPRKSVTAFIGLSDSPTAPPRGCQGCPMAEHCVFRRRGLENCSA